MAARRGPLPPLRRALREPGIALDCSFLRRPTAATALDWASSELRVRLTEGIAARDWETAKALVADDIANLQALDLGT